MYVARMERERNPGTLDYVSLHPGYVIGFEPVKQFAGLLRDPKGEHDDVSGHTKTVARVRDVCA